jgi:hypothetical protein
MDNKQNRQFYWEVKDFMNKKNTPPAGYNQPKKNGVVDSVKTILEHNKPFRQKPTATNSNTINTISQVISGIQNEESRFKPECKAFTKNMDTNPFRSLRENFSLQDLANAFNTKKMSETNSVEDLDMENVTAELEALGDVNTASPETRKRYVALRNREAALKSAAESEQMESDEAEALSVGSRLTTTSTGAIVGEKPDFVKQRESIAAAEEMGPPKSLAGAEEMGPPSSLATSTTPSMPVSDNQLDQRVKARIAARDRSRQREMQQGEENLAYLKGKGAPQTAEGRGRYAQALLRAERRAKGGQGSGLSDEQIRGQEERALARERRTPEQKEADRARDAAVVADLSKKADEVRAKEAAQKAKTPTTTAGTQTASASQTAPKSYRI